MWPVRVAVLARHRVPQEHHAIVPAGGERAAVWAEGQRVDRAGVAGERGQERDFAVLANLPDIDDAVHVGCCQERTVLAAEGDRPDLAFVRGREFGQFLPGVIDDDDAVSDGNREEIRLRMERDFVRVANREDQPGALGLNRPIRAIDRRRDRVEIDDPDAFQIDRREPPARWIDRHRVDRARHVVHGNRADERSGVGGSGRRTTRQRTGLPFVDAITRFRPVRRQSANRARQSSRGETRRTATMRLAEGNRNGNQDAAAFVGRRTWFHRRGDRPAASAVSASATSRPVWLES